MNPALRRATDLLRAMLRQLEAGAQASGPTPLRALVTLAMFFTGLSGFARVYRPDSAAKWTDCLFRTAQLVTGQFPQELLPAPGAPRIPIPLDLNVARFALPVLVFWLALSGIVRRIRRPLRAAGARMLADHLVLAGSGEAIPALLGEAAAAGRRAIVVQPPGAGVAEDRLGDAVVITGELGDAACWRRVGLARAGTVAIVGIDDAGALAATLTAADVTREERAAGMPPLQLVCAVDDADVRALLDGVFRGRDPAEGVVLSATSPARLRARALLAQHPLYRGIDVAADEPVHVLVAGFGRTGEEIAIEVLKTGIVGDGVLPRVTVIDPEAARRERSLRERYAHAEPLDRIGFLAEALDSGDGAGIARLCERVGRVGAIYLCLPDETIALLSAVALRRWAAAAGIGAPPIYLRAQGGGELGRRLAAASLGDVDLTRIHVFGHEDARTLDAVSGASLDARARRIHARYLTHVGSGRGSLAQRPWALLGELYRQANRDQADYLPMRLAALGLAEVPAAAAAAPLPEATIERGARAEHARWMTGAALAGWRVGPRDDHAMRHPDLIPFDALDAAGREKDRSVLRHLADQLADGCAVAPLRTVTLTDLAGDDAAVIVEARLESAAEASALRLEVARRPGLRVRLRPDPGVLAAARRWPEPRARADALWLLENADQVLWAIPAPAAP